MDVISDLRSAIATFAMQTNNKYHNLSTIFVKVLRYFKEIYLSRYLMNERKYHIHRRTL